MGLVAVSLGVTLLGLLLSTRVHHQWGPLVLGFASAAVLLLGMSHLDLLSVGVATSVLVIASGWNFFLHRGVAMPRRR